MPLHKETKPNQIKKVLARLKIMLPTNYWFINN